MRRRSQKDERTPPAVDGWKPDELNLRRREVTAAEKNTKAQKWIQSAQGFSVVVALASTIVALYAAPESASAANSAAQISEQQTDEAQLASAISSFDAGNSSTRATRLVLAARDMQQILSLPPSAEQGQRDALGDYSTLLDALSIYLRSHGARSTAPLASVTGYPRLPRSIQRKLSTMLAYLRMKDRPSSP